MFQGRNTRCYGRRRQSAQSELSQLLQRVLPRALVSLSLSLLLAGVNGVC